MPKVKPKLHTYSIISDAIESGLGFALNRLEDCGVEMTDDQRETAMPKMMNEIMVAVCEVINFDND